MFNFGERRSFGYFRPRLRPRGPGAVAQTCNKSLNPTFDWLERQKVKFQPLAYHVDNTNHGQPQQNEASNRVMDYGMKWGIDTKPE